LLLIICRGTFGGCYSTTLGAVLHELCHTFDLGHTRKGIMGRGFDRMDLIFSPDESQDVSNLSHHIVDFTVNLKVDCVAKSEPKNEQMPMLGLRKSKSSSNNLLVMDCRDQIYFTQSCAYILAHHK
jgi:Putative peptidase family